MRKAFEMSSGNPKLTREEAVAELNKQRESEGKLGFKFKDEDYASLGKDVSTEDYARKDKYFLETLDAVSAALTPPKAPEEPKARRRVQSLLEKRK